MRRKFRMRNSDAQNPNSDEIKSEQAGTRTCEVCGQTFDLSDVDQLFHHGPEPHEPLLP